MRNWSLICFLSVATISFAAAHSSAQGAEATNLKPAAQLPPAAQRKIDFVSDIQPMLADHCYRCHGPKKAESGLKLHIKKDALAGGDSGQVITPGNSAESALVKYVSGLDPDETMPPAGGGKRLTPAEVGLVRAWIDQGANWPDEADEHLPIPGGRHWAYQKRATVQPPVVRGARKVSNQIDRFILARLEAEGLTPSPEADRGVLLRRVSLDLTGLPPTPEEVAAFLADESPDAYEKVVDRLLASPQFGERWATFWLDLARYGDSDGYEKDLPRNMWAYRDWVIKAINADMPFDQFTIEQLAGDLLPNATYAQKIATGFNRNTMTNTEGGTDDEEFRSAAIIDRISTVSTVWLGATMACCQCHDHKYDPFTQKEFYQFFALFNSTADRGKVHEPIMGVPPEGIEKIDAEKAEIQARMDQATPELDAAQAEWEKVALKDAPQWTTLDVTDFKAPSEATYAKQPDGSILIGGPLPDEETYTITVANTLPSLTAIRLEALTDDSLPMRGPGRAPNGNFVLSSFRVETIPAGKKEAVRKLEFKTATADFSQVNYSAAGAIDRRDSTGWAVNPQMGRPHELVAELANDLSGAHRLKITIVQGEGSHHLLGRFRLSATDAKRPVHSTSFPKYIAQLLEDPNLPRSDEDRHAIATLYHSKFAPQFEPERKRLAELNKLAAPITDTLVMQELINPRQSYVFERGNFLLHGDKVDPGVPAIMPPFPAEETVNRLTFARWLVGKDNAVTARVTVNHFWEQLFGQGIVETSEDFGTQGELPTHPELLEWLASRYVDSGWRTKDLIKLMVMSAAYRQTSRVTPELLEIDPRNQLFARGPRKRLDAEMVRDQALALSGLLSLKMGGPPVMPPLASGIIIDYDSVAWKPSTGEDRYRRALYSAWRRTTPYPSFMSFDAPSREFCVVRRIRSNTPLQALNILNDPVYVEASQALARRMMTEGGTTPEGKVASGLRICLARAPHAAEMEKLLELYAQERDRYKHDPEATKKFIAEGAGEKPVEGFDPVELAAWTVVANVILNLDELMTRG